MNYPRSVYEDFGAFFAQALEVAKEKVSIYNATMKAIQSGRYDEELLNVLIIILRQVGWQVFTAIVGLIALGAFAFYGGIAVLIAAMPVLAAILAASVGVSVYVIWNNRGFVIASKKVGDRYKEDFDFIVSEIPDVSTRIRPIERLLYQCVVSLCREAFNISSDEMINQLVGGNTLSKLNEIKKILILAANPQDTDRLRLDKEVREITNGVNRARGRDQFEVKVVWAVRALEFRQAVLDYQPQFIHFSGHGAGHQGIVLENDEGQARLISTDTLADFFKLFTTYGLECVLLNACYSEIQADAISKHVNYVVGMREEILDEAAIVFSTAFYEAIVCEYNIQFAHELGCNAIQFLSIPQHLVPILKQKRS
jgi:predicted peroxiredoxin